MSKHKINQYDFSAQYEQDWQAWIGQFLPDRALPEGHLFLRIKECCCDINESITELYQSDPSYRMQMDIYMQWKYLLGFVEDKPNAYSRKALHWFARQLMNMIVCNNPAIVESIWYSIGVDYFECGNDGRFLFPIMYNELPEGHIPKLVEASISIPWSGKVDTYRAMIRTKLHHKLLANAILSSCQAYCYGSAKSSEAIEILNQLEVDRELYERVSITLTTPIPVQIVDACKLERKVANGHTGFVSVQHIDFPVWPTWFPYAELWINNQYVGTFAKDYYRLTWTKIQSEHHVVLPEENWSDKKILAVNIPIDEAWVGKTAELRPT